MMDGSIESDLFETAFLKSMSWRRYFPKSRSFEIGFFVTM
jgi:hypothetical protein